MGSSFEAWMAGIMPLMVPTMTRMAVATMTMVGETRRWMSAASAFEARAL